MMMYKVCLIGLMAIASITCCAAERLLLAGCGWKKIVVLDKKSGTIEWEHALASQEDCNDVELTREGNILYAYRGGARLINSKHEILWDFKVQKGEELYTATQLPDGRYMLAVCGIPSRIIELDNSGKLLMELKFDTGIKNVHGQFRQIQKLDSGNYLIPLMEKGEVVEMNPEGIFLKRVKCGGMPYSLFPLSDNRWLVSCGDGHNWVELDWTNGKILRIMDDKLLGYKIHFAAEVSCSASGNMFFSNWNGHTKDKSQPLLIELEQRGKVVWKLYASPEIQNISSVFWFNREIGEPIKKLISK